MTIKEELFALMQRFAATAKHDKITVFICCESNSNRFCSIVGYRNQHGTGTVLHITATSDVIDKLLNDVLNAAHNTKDGNSES